MIDELLHNLRVAIGVSDLRKSEKDGKALIGGRRDDDNQYPGLTAFGFGRMVAQRENHGAICEEHKKFMKEDAENDKISP